MDGLVSGKRGVSLRPYFVSEFARFCRRLEMLHNRRTEAKLILHRVLCYLGIVLFSRCIFVSLSSTPKIRSGKLYLCGYIFEDFARAVFPEKTPNELTVYNIKKTAATDLLIWSGDCPLLPWFAGVVLYVDGEAGKMPKISVSLTKRQASIFYIGVRKPPQRVSNHMQLFHMAHTTLLRDYSANDLMHTRHFARKHIAPEFLLYVNSHCIHFREEAYDRLCLVAASHGLRPPVSRGRCHGKHPETSKFRDDRLLRNQNAAMLTGFRFMLVMENSFTDGYITEKILDAYLANSVPVYYGTKDVFRIFNRDSFIYYDIEDPEPAISTLLTLEQNNSAYLEKLNAPILAEGELSLKKYFSLTDDVGSGELKHKIRSLVGLRSNGRFEPGHALAVT